MSIVDRVKNICLSPASEWQVIAAEPATTQTLLAGYAAPLAAIPAVAGFIGGSIVGRSLPFTGYYRVPIVSGLTSAILGFVLAIAGAFVLSLIINALAPTFGGRQDPIQALKVAVYSATPGWVAGVLLVLPGLGILAALAGLYGLYLLYLGLPRLMQSPADRALPYTAVVIVSAIVIWIVVAVLVGLLVGLPTAAGGAFTSSAPAATAADPNSPAGRLEALGAQLEENSRRMDEAERKGDTAGQAAAAMDSLGALLGGGRRSEPVAIDTLKPFVPGRFAGLPQTSASADRSGVAGLTMAMAEADYGDGERRAHLEVTDTGGAGGLLGLAAWAGVEGEHEDDDAVERTRRVNGRFVHERESKRGGTNEFSTVVAERFMVSATGDGVSLSALRDAVASLDLAGLEALK